MFILPVTIMEYMKAARSPPRCDPAKSQALWPRATPRRALSAALLVMQKQPSSRNREKASQRPSSWSMEVMALATGLCFGILPEDSRVAPVRQARQCSLGSPARRTSPPPVAYYTATCQPHEATAPRSDPPCAHEIRISRRHADRAPGPAAASAPGGSSRSACPSRRAPSRFLRAEALRGSKFGQKRAQPACGGAADRQGQAAIDQDDLALGPGQDLLAPHGFDVQHQ